MTEADLSTQFLLVFETGTPCANGSKRSPGENSFVHRAWDCINIKLGQETWTVRATWGPVSYTSGANKNGAELLQNCELTDNITETGRYDRQQQDVKSALPLLQSMSVSYDDCRFGPSLLHCRGQYVE